MDNLKDNDNAVIKEESERDVKNEIDKLLTEFIQEQKKTNKRIFYSLIFIILLLIPISLILILHSIGY